MSVKKLDAAILSLPSKGRGVEHVDRLSEALGQRINKREKKRLRTLIGDEWKKFNAAGTRALEHLTSIAMPGTKSTPFHLAKTRETGVLEQSALTFISKSAGFLTVDDEAKAIVNIRLLATTKGEKVSVKTVASQTHTMNGLEGATYDADTSELLVLSENSRKLFSLPLSEVAGELSLGKPKPLAKLPEVGADPNGGWEGLSVLRAHLSPDKKAHLLAVNELDPPGLGIFDRETLKLEAFVELPPQLAHIEDLSDLAVDPKTGRLFLLSDRNEVIIECILSKRPPLLSAGKLAKEWALIPVGEIPLPPLPVEAGVRLQPEGLTFDEKGDLYVACEGQTKFFHFARG